MTRKIIQISAIPDSEHNWPGVYALCDDGSLWAINYCPAVTTAWWQLPPIPQPKPLGEDE
jgi:hypothetical protein